MRNRNNRDSQYYLRRAEQSTATSRHLLERIKAYSAREKRLRRMAEAHREQAQRVEEREWARERVKELFGKGKGPSEISDVLYEERSYRMLPRAISQMLWKMGKEN
jgi:acetyl-CoA carboxylase carboxyltransferase component